jgi:hypothetical protein
MQIHNKTKQYITMQVSSVVPYWTREQMVMRLNPGRVEFISCSRHVIVLHCTKNCRPVRRPRLDLGCRAVEEEEEEEERTA